MKKKSNEKCQSVAVENRQIKKQWSQPVLHFIDTKETLGGGGSPSDGCIGGVESPSC